MTTEEYKYSILNWINEQGCQSSGINRRKDTTIYFINGKSCEVSNEVMKVCSVYNIIPEQVVDLYNEVNSETTKTKE